MSRVRVLIGVAGLAGAATVAAALPAWPAPQVETLNYDYFTAGCDTSSQVAEAFLFTRVDRAATVDDDNDVNVGTFISTSLEADGTDGPVDVPGVDTTFVMAGGHPTVTTDFVVPGRDPVTLASAPTYVVPAADAGSVLDFGVTRIADHTVADCLVPAELGTLSVYVNRPPELTGEVAWTYADTPITVPVLDNDDATWDSGTIDTGSVTLEEAQETQDNLSRVPAPHLASHVSLAASAGDGTCVIDPDGQITYTPDPGHVGADVCVYGVTDNDGAYAEATLQLQVIAAADIDSLTLTATAVEVAQGESVDLTAFGSVGGHEIGDVTSDVTFTSDVPSDVIDGSTVTFPTASPHTIIGTHASGATATIVIEVTATGGAGGSDADGSAVGDGLPDAGGPPAYVALLGFALLGTGVASILLARRRGDGTSRI